MCRLVARKACGHRPMTHEDISKVSGLPVSTISVLSKRTSWRGVKIDMIEKFTLGCGVNLIDVQRQMEYLRRRKMIHITRASPLQRRMYQRIFCS